jgi:hypothetical protein
VNNDKNYHAKLAPIFGMRQVRLIEATFEGWYPVCGATKAGRAFYELYEYPEDRMKAIFQNVIDNKGVFRP